jgi:hypothetical protein
VRRFLAVIEYQLRGGWEMGDRRQEVTELAPTPNSQLPTPNSHSFATFAFLLDEIGGELQVQDADERIEAFGELAVAELPALAETLEHVPNTYDDQIDGSWREWGRFRAVAHREIYAALTSDKD